MKMLPPNQAPDADQAETRQLRLLVVEDHGDLCLTLKGFFAMLGHRARFAHDVASALRVANEESFDVLLSDIGLPDGTGWELLRQLRQSGHEPACAIAMSGYGLESHLSESVAAGFDLHLIKPFAPEALENALNAVSPGSQRV